MTPLFRDRKHAGEVLATLLSAYAGPDTLVLGLPRGGVPLAAEVASALNAELDALVVRKIGAPGHEELAIGAIGPGGVIVWNDDLPQRLGLDQQALQRAVNIGATELERREQRYRANKPPLVLKGRTVILVDDGLATGATMRVAVAAVRNQNPARIIVAVPVGARQARDALAPLVDDVVMVATPEPFTAVGLWYEQFPPVSDDEVLTALGSR